MYREPDNGSDYEVSLFLFEGFECLKSWGSVPCSMFRVPRCGDRSLFLLEELFCLNSAHKLNHPFDCYRDNESTNLGEQPDIVEDMSALTRRKSLNSCGERSVFNVPRCGDRSLFLLEELFCLNNPLKLNHPPDSYRDNQLINNQSIPWSFN